MKVIHPGPPPFFFSCVNTSFSLILQIVMAKYLEFTEEVTVTGSELQMCNANLLYMSQVVACMNERTVA